MGIRLQIKTKNKAAVKVYNVISSFLFEQECDILKDRPKAKEALINAQKELVNIINNG